MQINMPSLAKSDGLKNLRGQSREKASDAIVLWLTQGHHWLAGRQWKPFYTRSGGKKTIKRLRGGETSSFFEQVTCFAVDGHTFQMHDNGRSRLPTKSSSPRVDDRMKVSLEDVLDWALNFEHPENANQKSLKLFSRIALSLSRTTPGYVLEPHQIRHRHIDVKSPSGSVMNDGCARMSPALAREIAKVLQLDENPSGFQARLGSAKGFWVVDPLDTTDDVWIETFPSQRKWKCDFASDEDMRTFEVKTPAHNLKSANSNLQFIVVLGDRAENKEKMRHTLAGMLTDQLEASLKEQRIAMQDPIRCREWIDRSAFGGCRDGRAKNKGVEFLGGLPRSDDEMINVMLDAGFHPGKNQLLQEALHKRAQRQCEMLMKTLKISIPSSAYAFMVPDFSGVLQPGEVYLDFLEKVTLKEPTASHCSGKLTSL